MQTQSVEYVGFWIRFIAFVIDSIAATVAIGFLVALFFGGSADIDPANIGAALPQVSIQTVLTAVIFIAFWMYYAATPGKMVFDAYIVDATTLKRASNGKLVIRYLGYYLIIFVFFLGFIWIAFDDRKQGWHDKIAGTVVIKGKPLDDPSPA